MELQHLAYLISVPEIGRKTVLKIKHQLEQQSLSIVDYIEHKLWLNDHILNEKQRENFKKFNAAVTLEQYSEQLAKEKIRIITPADEEYPVYLRQIDDQPVALFARGALLRNDTLTVAVVGSRKITPYGKAATDFLVSDFMGYPTCIVSGCMYGVDMAAHQAALKHKLATVGVLGFGFHHCYPASLAKTLEQMLAQGATLITEFSPETPAQPGNFPVRNRIVAGIAQATVVVEASPGSGSLITAECAVEYDRFIGAVPGPYYSQYSAGTKWLINQGAKLVTSAQDILEELYDSSHLPKKSAVTQETLHWDSLAEKSIYDQLVVARDCDELFALVKLPIADFNYCLTNLELKQLIIRKGTFVERV